MLYNLHVAEFLQYKYASLNVSKSIYVDLNTTWGRNDLGKSVSVTS